MPVYLCGSRDQVPEGVEVINTTSRSKNWSRGLSPFFCGPCYLYMHNGEHLVAKNVENSWQFCKVSQEYGDENGPFSSYWSWARAGWSDSYAHRYPMGKGAIPLYSFWDGEKLDYIEARKKIYIPLYSQAVVKTEAWKQLKSLYDEKGEVALFDFDVYPYYDLGMSLDDALNCRERKFGHGFVLLMLLLKKSLI